MTRKENHPGRRGSVNISSIGSRRRSSVVGPNSANAAALLASPRSALPAAATRRGSVQPMGNGGGRRPSNFLRQQHPVSTKRHSVSVGAGAGAGTSSQITKLAGQQQQQQQLGRRLSVSHRPSPVAVPGRRISVSHAITAKAGGTTVIGGSTDGNSSNRKSAVNSEGSAGTGTEVSPEASALSKRRASLLVAKKECTTSRVRVSPLATTDEARGESTTHGFGGTGADALPGKAAVAARKDKVGPFTPQREDTFDAAAGRFPVHNM